MNPGNPNNLESAKNNTSKERHVKSRFFFNHALRKAYIIYKESNDPHRNFVDDSINDVKFYPGLNTPEGTLKQITFFASRLFGDLFKDQKEKFEKLLKDLGSREYGDDEEILTTFVDTLHEFANNPDHSFTRERIEQHYRENRRNKIPLLEGIIDCDISPDNSTTVRIHLVGTSSLGLGKIKEAFKNLTEKFKDHSEGSAWNNIQSVSMRSWIVYERPEFFTKLGFKLTPIKEQDKEIGHAIVTMDREEFIKRFG